MSEISSEDFLRFGDEYTPKILKELNIEIFQRSRIDGKILIELDSKNHTQRKLLERFLKIEICQIIDDHIPAYKGEHFEPYFTPNGNKYVLKIVDFSTNGLKKYLRIKKLKKLEEVCQKYL